MGNLDNLGKSDLIKRLKESQAALACDVQEDKRLLHDLQTHQIEVELQNRDLREAQQELELARDRYADLYDFAPVGYLTLDRKGVISDANLTAALLLGVPRAALIDRPLAVFVAKASKSVFFKHLKAADASGKQNTTADVTICLQGGEQRQIRLASRDGIMEDQAFCYRVVMLDITEPKRAEQRLLESEARFRSLFDTMHSGVAVYQAVDDGQDFIIKDHNCGGERITGLSREEVIGRSVLEVFPGVEAMGLLDVLRRVWRSGRPEKHPASQYRDERLSLWMESEVCKLPSGEIVMIYEDITGKNQAESQMRLAAKVIENTQEGVVIANAELQIVSVNPAFEKLTGYSARESIGQSPSLLKSGYHDDNFYHLMWQRLHKEGCWQGEIWNRRKGGEIYPEWLNISCIRDNNGVITHYIGVFSDISTQKQFQERLHDLAYYDVLTKLPNRQLFQDRLKMSLARAQREGKELAVLFIDTDRFKAINDSLGHSMGDKVLQKLAEWLTKTLRKGDTISRLGGDEFTIIIPDIEHAESVAHIAAKLLEVSSQPLAIDGHLLHVSLSIGISIFPDDATGEEELLQQADTAMYRAKAEGGGRFQFYEQAMGARGLERLALEHELRVALENDLLQLAYQPQVDLQSGRWLGVEALARWHHPRWGWVPPAVFIPLAEEVDLIGKVGLWVLRKACRQHRAWLDAGLEPGCIAVNLSTIQLRQEDLTEMIARTLEQAKLDGNRLGLELTESMFMGNVENTIEVLRAIGNLGVEIAVDDFGSGYSSLNYLKVLPIDKLKIDRSFIKDLPQNCDDAAIATTIVAMAKTLGLKVIAEGVETEQQRAFLLEQGCDAMQGFLFSPPVFAEEIETMLRSH